MKKSLLIAILWCTGIIMWASLQIAECGAVDSIVLIKMDDSINVYYESSDDSIVQAKPIESGFNAGEQRGNCINVNTSSLDSLIFLPGIGPALAERIISFRIDRGPFNRIEDLDSVKGIGPSKLEKLKDKVCF
jgi:competence ComEA-like helix-hairpin-helix protein